MQTALSRSKLHSRRGSTLFRRTFPARTIAVVVLAFGVISLPAQTPPPEAAAKGTAPSAKVALIKGCRIILEKDGPAVEILSTFPLTPQIQLIQNPTRLVIDIANARIDMAEKQIKVEADQISDLRLNQFQETPPIARVVVDLLAPRAFTWDAAGNRLVVHLGKNPGEEAHSPFEQPTVPSLMPAPKPVIRAVRTNAPLAISTDTGNVGSSFTSGADTAVLSLSSGGEVRVCPGTTISITPSQNRHNLLLGLNTGAIETHLQLDSSADQVMTPDFRIMLEGPGQFHYAFSADKQGNTCVRALPGNTASAMATELLGNRSYQIKATDQLVFRSGTLDRVDMAVPLECGCPPPRQPPERAANDLPEQNTTVSELRPPANSNSLPDPATPPVPAPAPTTGVSAGNTAGPRAESRNDVHVQVTAPLVFQATGPPPAPVEDVQVVPLDTRPGSDANSKNSASVKTSGTTTQASTTNPPHRGFFARIGGFFSRLFH